MHGSTVLYMPEQASRVQKKKAISDTPMRSLIGALNDDDGRVKWGYSREKIVLLVRELRKLDAASSRWTSLTRAERRRTTLPDKNELRTSLNAVMETVRTVSSMLVKYKASPSLHIDLLQKEPFRWRLEWTGSRELPHFDLVFALEAIEILKAGKINSIKECDQCRKWFLARFQHQRFCSVECKDQFHASNEADKARRREWARENYQTRKELELGSRKAAAQKKRGKR